MAFNWEQDAFLGYMVEQHEKVRGNDIFGRPLNDTNIWDTDEDDTEEEDDNNYWPF